MADAAAGSVAGGGEVIELSCRACGTRAAMPRIVLREMMFGTRERFDYGLCPACGSLSIAAVPADLARHYPEAYYAPRGGAVTRQDGPLARWATRTQVERRYFGRRSPLVRVARRIAPIPKDVEALESLLPHGVPRSTRAAIADVGCTGHPNRLARLRRLGFSDLTGVEPYIDHDLVFQGVPVRRGDLGDLDRSFDLIMFHHSLEHVADPVAVLRDSRARLRDGGRVLVRTPIMGGAHWRTWQRDWVELDAPRHLVLFTIDGLTAAARAAGLVVHAVVWESGAWESIASDQYRRDLAMYEPGSWFVDRDASGYDAEQLKAFRALATDLVASGAASRAAISLEAAPTEPAG